MRNDSVGSSFRMFINYSSQFAYNFISVFLVKLFQRFDRIELASDMQTPDARPPEHWASGGGRRAQEKIFLKNHLTLYVHVSTPIKWSE